MNITIHRGTSQIGGSIVEVATATTRIILDCGKNLPPLDGTYGKDTIDVYGLTVGESQYDAVFITHYHADHCGLVECINADISVYMSRETKNVLDIISVFTDSPMPRATQILQPGHDVIVGDIKLIPLDVHHSAAGAMMFVVEADGKKLVYTGDFNYIDPSYSSLLNKIDVLLCEGTNIGVRNGLTESDVEREATRIMMETKGQVFVLCSTTNIDRIRCMERACHQSGRTIAIDPFAKAILDKVARTMFVDPVGFVPHYIDAEKTPRSHKHLTTSRDICGNGNKIFSSAKAVSKMKNLTFLVRQTMGEFLKRLNNITTLEGSTLIYSMWRGYENMPKTKQFLGLCHSLGIKIEYVHASGHAYREVLEGTILNLKPEVLIPIHTESSENFLEMHDNVVLLRDGGIFEC